MTRVDLDAFEREWVFSSQAAPFLRDLVAELRVAREVVEESREVIKAAGELVRTTGTPNAAARVAYADAAFVAAIAELSVGLSAYDQATGGGT